MLHTHCSLFPFEKKKKKMGSVSARGNIAIKSVADLSIQACLLKWHDAFLSVVSLQMYVIVGGGRANATTPAWIELCCSNFWIPAGHPSLLRPGYCRSIGDIRKASPAFCALYSDNAHRWAGLEWWPCRREMTKAQFQRCRMHPWWEQGGKRLAVC